MEYFKIQKFKYGIRNKNDALRNINNKEITDVIIKKRMKYYAE